MGRWNKSTNTDSVNNGLVIEDRNGNEFVWVPVTGNYERNTTYEDTNVSTTAYADTGYLPDGMETGDSTNNENAERTAVTSKGGFYISRYEAGKETEGSTNTLVSKSSATVWNEISQEDTKTEAKKFINNDNVKSSLCSGIQWDMTMAFVNGKQDGSSDANKTFNVTQYKANRHIGLPKGSGQNVVDRVCNIYDLEGNLYEYIAEKNSYDSSKSLIFRGGYYNNSNTASASVRNYGNGTSSVNVSFRFVLYVM